MLKNFLEMGGNNLKLDLIIILGIKSHNAGMKSINNLEEIGLRHKGLDTIFILFTNIWFEFLKIFLRR